MNQFKNKRIILALPHNFAFSKCFIDNLSQLGFEVFCINSGMPDFRYPSIIHRVINFYKKTFFNDRSYKQKLGEKFILDKNINLINAFPYADYSLCIRPDDFDKQIINLITSKSKHSYLYQWDGLSRFPVISEVINKFDKFYIFDHTDKKEYPKSVPLTNFYFDCYPNLFKNTTPKYDVFFIGFYDERFERLISICEILKSHRIKLNIILFSPAKKLKHISQKYPYITIITKPLTYFENLQIVSNSKILIDLHYNNVHTGLSFRTFEALGYGKKLITTNAIVKNYDFYDESNILVVDKNISDEKILDFVDIPYKEIDREIKYKYSFTNWVKYVLEQEDAIPI